MIPDFNEGRAMVALDNGRAISILSAERTGYIENNMMFFDSETDGAAADEDSYEVAFVVGDDEEPDRDFIPDGWSQYIDPDRTDMRWRIFGRVPHQVVHAYLDEHATSEEGK